MTKIMKCTCEHAWQNKVYGKSMRVFNGSEKEKGKFTCTVCSSTKTSTAK